MSDEFDEFVPTLIKLKNVEHAEGVSLKTTLEPEKREGPRIQYLVVAFPWAAIALDILVYAAKHAIANYLDDLYREKSCDLQALLTQFLQLAAAVLRKELDQDYLRDMRVDALYAQQNFSNYGTDPDPKYLWEAQRTAMHISNRAYFFGYPKKLGYQVASDYGIAGSLELAALLEKTKHNAAAKDTVRDRARALTTRVMDLAWGLSGDVLTRFGKAEQVGRGPGTGKWYYEFDGLGFPPGGCDTEREAIHARGKHHDQVFKDLEKQILSPLYRVRDKWVELAR
jgi:hypothetical protein